MPPVRARFLKEHRPGPDALWVFPAAFLRSSHVGDRQWCVLGVANSTSHNQRTGRERRAQAVCARHSSRGRICREECPMCLRVCFAWLLFSCAVTIIACSSSPTTPSRLPVAGMWVGSHTLTSCSGGRDFRSCGRFPKTGTLTLTLSQAEGNVTGTMTIEVPSPSSTNDAFFTTADIPVVGTASVDGTLRLSGSAPLDQTRFGVESVRLTDWTTSASNRDMSGQFALSTSGYYFDESQTFNVTSDVRLTKTALQDAR